MKYIDADKLIAEIERRLKDYWELSFHNVKAYNEDSNVRELKELCSFIASLQKEKPEVDLEKEIRNYDSYLDESGLTVTLDAIARHFAEWGAEHLRDTTKMMPEGLDEAAEKSSQSWRKNPDGSESREMLFQPHIRGFKAGAEWMAGQGVTIEAKFIKSRLRGHISLPVFFKDGEQFNNGEDVIIQVRKK